MRKIRVIAFVVASLVSTASLVHAQSAAPAAPGAHGGRHGMRGGMRGDRGRNGPFKGITLSDVEKAKLKEIHGKYATQGKSLRESMKPAMQEARTLRQKGDTAGARAVLARNKGTFDQMKALHDRQRAEVRGALTTDHQKLFDANVQAQATRRADWAKNGRKGGRKHGPRGANG